MGLSEAILQAEQTTKMLCRFRQSMLKKWPKIKYANMPGVELVRGEYRYESNIGQIMYSHKGQGKD